MLYLTRGETILWWPLGKEEARNLGQERTKSPLACHLLPAGAGVRWVPSAPSCLASFSALLV